MMVEEDTPHLLFPGNRKRIAKLLGGKKWGAEAERFVEEHRDLFAPNKQRPFPELSEEEADHIIGDLQRGQKICQRVLVGQDPTSALQMWLNRVKPTYTGWILDAFDRVFSPSPLPIRGSGSRGKRRTASPELSSPPLPHSLVASPQ